ncbi:MAG TPA: aldo/keto reductase [Firmicutes bacterium]|nr:aldo/keto reductase [Bacillota bacterium]
MERRILGKTGERVSIIGFGGIVVMNLEQGEANSIVAEAIDRGVNYFDVAPTYGNAEDRLGPAIEHKRDGIFLACKTGKRRRVEAAAELRESLRKLRTDHFDLYQLHAMVTEEDFEQAMGPGGAIEALIEAREEGLVRYLGFSAHSVEIALKLIDAFDFDTVLFPVNWVNYFNAGFGPQVLERAQTKGMGCLAIKAMARTLVPEGQKRKYAKCWYEPVDDPELAALALRFTLSQSVAAAIPPGEPDLFRIALNVGERFTMLTEGELETLRQRARGLEPIFRLSA